MTILITGVRAVDESKVEVPSQMPKAEPPPVVEGSREVVKKKFQVPTATPVVNNQDEKILRAGIQQYVEMRKLKYPTDQDIKLAIIEFSKLAEHCRNANKVGLFKILFEELFVLHGKVILNPYGMFHGLKVLAPREQQHVLVLYEVMMKLLDYQTSPTKRQFSMDLSTIESMYDATNFTQFIRTIITR